MSRTDLPKDFLSTLVPELDGSDILGIVLGGSHARGDAGLYSDVDVALFVKDDVQPPPKQFFYRDGYLVSIAFKNVAGIREEISRPNRAIFVVPGLRGATILLDKNGSVGNLLRDIDAFVWEPLQPAADSYASYTVMALAEQVHKVLTETPRGNELALAYATAKLLPGLTEAVAVQRGVLVKSDNTYYEQVEAVAGPEWAKDHRIVAGVDAEVGDATPATSRALAAVRLYRETVEFLRSSMEPAHLAIAERAVKIAESEVNLGL
ncbi:MAG TPA: nucleotidyltransferase domain-containing protein [Chloroflexia bacterium]